MLGRAIGAVRVNRSQGDKGTVMEKTRGMQGINGFTGAMVTGFCFLVLAASSAQAAAPSIVKTGVSEVTSTSATLQAEVNPEGKVTQYRFEYGTADCAFNPCTEALA